MNIPNIPSTASVAFLCTVMDVFMVFLSLAVQLQCVLPLLSSRRIYVRGSLSGGRGQRLSARGTLQLTERRTGTAHLAKPGLRSIEQS
jgi:hypothetical protein